VTTDPKQRSIMKRLSNVSKERGAAYQFVLTEFLIERMVVRLASSASLAKVFVFKGGYVGQRAYGSPRYTVDLDALLRRGNPIAIEQEVISTLEMDSQDGTWYRFEKKVDLTTQGEYPGIRYAFRAGIGTPLQDLRRAQLLNFDIGVGDAVDPIESTLQPILDRESVSWLVYPREVIIAEKLHSFLSRPLENSRSKDLFDLQFHLPKADASGVVESTRRTFKARGDDVPQNVAEAFSELRTDTLRRGWVSAVFGLPNAPSLDE
jgi:hypothetical protein